MNKNKELSHYRVAGILAMTTVIFLATTAYADSRSWVGQTGEWHNVSNWDGGVSLPEPADDVTIAATGASVILTNSVNIRSLTLSKTLIFTNWNTHLSATHDITIRSNGLMTCAGPFTNAPAMSNRVNLVCSNLLVDKNGAINVSGKGYAGGRSATVSYAMGSGPGAGARYGGSHGGAGRTQKGTTITTGNPGNLCTTKVYGNPEAPLSPGSGGSMGFYFVNNAYGGDGGGAVRISADNVTVNGQIKADATPAYHSHSAGGAGGSIFITCTTIAGTGGTLTANGSDGLIYAGGGGGGRIAVLYDPIAQANLPVPSICFSTIPGKGNAAWGGASDSAAADPGTLYFLDNYFLSPTNVFTGQWLVPNFTEWSVSDLLISNSWLRLPGAGFRLTVANKLTVVGTDHLLHGLELTDADEVRCTECRLDGAGLTLNPSSQPIGYDAKDVNYGRGLMPADAAVTGVILTCADDLTLTNSARLSVSGGLSFPGAEAGYGALVNVGRDILIGNKSWIFTVAHPTNGAAVLLRMENMTVSPSGGIDANYGGYMGYKTQPFGPGKASHANSGAGHGGLGGVGVDSPLESGGPTYGSSNAPVSLGSGSGSQYSWQGAWGGGSVQIRAAKTLNVQGTITANGGAGAWLENGGASGGSIYIQCETFIGHSNGVLRANGGAGDIGAAANVGKGAGGGGGRIAVWRVVDRSPSVIASVVDGGGAKETAQYGEKGTVVWGWLPPPGTVILIR